LVEIAIFSYPLHSTPPSGEGIRRSIAIPFCAEKTRIMGLLDGEKKMRICVTV